MTLHATLTSALLSLVAAITGASEAQRAPSFAPAQGWILVRHGSPEAVQAAIAEYDGLAREVRPGTFRVELHPQRDGGVAVLLPDGLPAYDMANLAGWLDAPPGQEDEIHGATAWIVSPSSGVKFSLVPEVANEWGDTMLGASREGVSIRVARPEGRVSVIAQPVAYQAEPYIDVAADPVRLDVTLDTNTGFGNPGFIIDR